MRRGAREGGPASGPDRAGGVCWRNASCDSMEATRLRPDPSNMKLHNTMRALARAGFLVLVVLVAACGVDAPVERDLAAIRRDGELRVLFTYNSTGYFVYRGEIMGYDFSLLRAFAKENDLELKPVVVREPERLYEMLRSGEGDVAAARLVATREDSGDVAFTRGLYPTRPMLVQRSGPPSELRRPAVLDGTPAADPDSDGRGADTLRERGGSGSATRDSATTSSDTLPALELRAKLIRRPAQLAGDTFDVPRHFPFSERLLELSDSVGEDITVVEVEDALSIEPLIARVARGEIRLTVAPNDVAQLTEDYYRNITVRPALGPTAPAVWAVRPNSPELLAALDGYIQRGRADGEFDAAYEKYFEDRDGFRERTGSDFLTSETGRLSKYDDLLRGHASELGWDWRLLASQTFQESRFDPLARSWAGASGLLQLMPGTAQDMGVTQPTDPEQNVRGAVKYLKWLDEKWTDEIPDPDERVKFVLASYNAGFGHVADARRLAERDGDDPDSWDDVAYWLVQLSRKQVYNDPVVEYGFCRGLEPVTYVSLILERYSNYLNFVKG